MLNEREAIRAHARERLERAGAVDEHARRVELFKRFLKLETDRRFVVNSKTRSLKY
jgi:hypothetical protein